MLFVTILNAVGVAGILLGTAGIFCEPSSDVPQRFLLVGAILFFPSLALALVGA